MDEPLTTQGLNKVLNDQQYNVGSVPYHQHTGSDSPNVNYNDLLNKVTLAVSGGTALTGNVVLAAGSNVTVTESGQTITIASTAPSSPSQISSTYTAGEALTAGDAVCAGYYLASGETGFDAKQSGTIATDGSGNGTVSFTVGNNANRVLYIFLGAAGNGTDYTNVKYNGVAVTTIDSVGSGGGAGFFRSAYLIAPSTGAHNFTFTGGSTSNYTYALYSFYNVSQASPVTGHNAAIFSSSTTPSLTVNSVGGAVKMIGAIFVANGTPTITTTGTWANENTTTVATRLTAGDSGAAFPTANVTASATLSAPQDGAVLMVGVTPLSTFASGIMRASSATGTFSNFRANDFIGFVTSSYAAGATATVYTAGVVTLPATIIAGFQYYLNDSNGSIGTSVGTVTRKVGIAITSNDILITNVW